jgi:hypothetical protein
MTRINNRKYIDVIVHDIPFYIYEKDIYITFHYGNGMPKNCIYIKPILENLTDIKMSIFNMTNSSWCRIEKRKSQSILFKMRLEETTKNNIIHNQTNIIKFEVLEQIDGDITFRRGMFSINYMCNNKESSNDIIETTFITLLQSLSMQDDTYITENDIHSLIKYGNKRLFQKEDNTEPFWIKKNEIKLE